MGLEELLKINPVQIILQELVTLVVVAWDLRKSTDTAHQHSWPSVRHSREQEPRHRSVQGILALFPEIFLAQTRHWFRLKLDVVEEEEEIDAHLLRRQTGGDLLQITTNSRHDFINIFKNQNNPVLNEECFLSS